jgi:hypothetical protein
VEIVTAEPRDADILTRVAFGIKGPQGYAECWIEGWRDALDRAQVDPRAQLSTSGQPRNDVLMAVPVLPNQGAHAPGFASGVRGFLTSGVEREVHHGAAT